MSNMTYQYFKSPSQVQQCRLNVMKLDAVVALAFRGAAIVVGILVVERSLQSGNYVDTGRVYVDACLYIFNDLQKGWWWSARINFFNRWQCLDDIVYEKEVGEHIVKVHTGIFSVFSNASPPDRHCVTRFDLKKGWLDGALIRTIVVQQDRCRVPDCNNTDWSSFLYE